MSERWLTWEQWRADELNSLFYSLGKTGEPGRILPSTVRHGEQTTEQRRWDSRALGISKDQLKRTSKRQWKGIGS